MIEMKVFGLALDEDSQVPVLILKDAKDENVLPIWIGAMEAMAISLAINDVSLPRPMTHDLLLSMIGNLGAKVLAVEVTALKDGTYYAEIELDQNGVNRRIDSRPSDAIALALRAEAPIRVSPDVLKQVTKNQKEQLNVAKPGDGPDKWTEILEKFNVDDTKYKM